MSHRRKIKSYESASYWEDTAVNDITTTFKWTIRRFDHTIRTCTENTLCSEVFEIPNCNLRGQICAKVLLATYLGEQLNVEVKEVSDNEEITEMFSISLSVLGGTSQKLVSKSWSTPWGLVKSCFFRDVFDYDYRDKFLVGEDLTLFCEISMHQIVSQGNLCTGPQESFSHFAATFFENPELSDVKFQVKSETFHGHLFVVATQSSVFRAMFLHDTQESRTRVVQVEEMEPVVFRELLRFIYCYKVENLRDLAMDLLVAADRYDVKKLVVLCENFLRKNLSIECVLEVSLFAKRMKLDPLAEACKHFINTHITEMMLLVQESMRS